MTTKNQFNKPYDVCILGGGLAGLGLARQISLENPNWNIIVLEKSQEVKNWKVGEATVELGAHYFMRKLGLTNYLYREHLPKNGLRFFFDNQEKNLPITQMSEIGSQGFPVHASFLVDRIKFEKDLMQMIREEGIPVLQGATVSKVTLSQDKSPHHIFYQENEKEHSLKADWIIDSSGRRKIINNFCINFIT